MLDLKNISKTFNPGTVNEKVALENVNLHLDDGDFATIVGSNGAGKSTLFNAIAGEFIADTGTITLDGRDITFLPDFKRSKAIGRMFQDPLRGTAPHMTIEENLALAKRRGKARCLRPGITAAEREEYKQLLKGLNLGLEDRMTTKVGLLSGGQLPQGQAVGLPGHQGGAQAQGHAQPADFGPPGVVQVIEEYGGCAHGYQPSFHPPFYRVLPLPSTIATARFSG